MPTQEKSGQAKAQRHSQAQRGHRDKNERRDERGRDREFRAADGPPEGNRLPSTSPNRPQKPPKKPRPVTPPTSPPSKPPPRPKTPPPQSSVLAHDQASPLDLYYPSTGFDTSSQYAPASSAPSEEKSLIIRINGSEVQATRRNSTKESFITEKLAKTLANIDIKKAKNERFFWGNSGTKYTAKTRIKTRVEVRGRSFNNVTLYLLSVPLKDSVILGTEFWTEVQNFIATPSSDSRQDSNQFTALSRTMGSLSIGDPFYGSSTEASDSAAQGYTQSTSYDSSTIPRGSMLSSYPQYDVKYAQTGSNRLENPYLSGSRTCDPSDAILEPNYTLQPEREGRSYSAQWPSPSSDLARAQQGSSSQSSERQPQHQILPEDHEAAGTGLYQALEPWKYPQ